MIKSINPSTNSVINNYKLHSDKDIALIIDSVSLEFKKWKNISFKDRSKILNDIAHDLMQNREIHSRMISTEIGKPIVESRMEIDKCIWVLNYFADNSSEFLKKKEIKTEYSESYIQYDPIGVILGIMPWNFPYWQVIRFIAPVLMSGNTCIIKHASNVSGCALLIEKLISNNSPFKNIYKTILISASKVKNIIKHKSIKAISLTGSEEAGSSVAMYAGKEIKKTVLELGGSDPFIVLADANIKMAAKVAVSARFFNSGQSCIAAKRFIIHKDVYYEFINYVHKSISNLIVGNALKDSTQVGPLAKKEFVKELDSIIRSSIALGAKCLLGGDMKDCFYMPTLLVDVTEEMEVFKKETFGPVLCVAKCEDADDAIRIANNSIYGLGGSLWTSDITLAKKLTKEINTGSIFINDMTKSDPRLPFGGINKSGYGIELSEFGIKEFVNIKTVVVN